jgi:RNA polymerase sigma factor (sigma-70 family)
MDKKTCVFLVAKFLATRGWELADPDELGALIHQELAGQGVSGDAEEAAVRRKIWPCYAEILHDVSSRPDDERHDQAWRELRAWLRNQVQRVSYRPDLYEDLVQETLIELQQQLLRPATQQPVLKAPRAFLVYSLQVLRNKAIDRERRETAEVHGGEATISSLEEMETTPSGEEAARRPLDDLQQRHTEEIVSKRQREEQLIAFFEEVLPTDLQRRVARATFKDGLKPREIAALLSKQPHEIRQAKARVIHTLRNLPADRRQRLLGILGRDDEISGSEEVKQDE